LPCRSFDRVWCRRHWREWLCWMHQRAHSFGKNLMPCSTLPRSHVLYNFSTLQGWQCRLTDEQFIAVKELVSFISYCVDTHSAWYKYCFLHTVIYSCSSHWLPWY
jgi:hypothetical protein